MRTTQAAAPNILRVDVAIIWGPQICHPPGAGQADLQRAPRHALAEEARGGGIWGGGYGFLGGRLHHLHLQFFFKII